MASYHHGDLRRVLLSTAAEAIAESGPAALSLRELARRAGVSHAAPAHHFGDKAGLLTALATQGFDLLADALRQAGDDLLDTGVAYVGFAVRHRAHFDVMFRPELYRADDRSWSPPARGRGHCCAAAWPGTPGGSRTRTRWPPGRSCTASPRSGSPARCRPGWATTRRPPPVP